MKRCVCVCVYVCVCARARDDTDTTQIRVPKKRHIFTLKYKEIKYRMNFRSKTHLLAIEPHSFFCVNAK